MLSQILIILVLSLITYDDLKYRSVRLYLFPLLATLLAYKNFQNFALNEILLNTAVNSIYIIVLLSLCYVYIFFKHKTKALFAFLGVGDLLLLLCFSLWFEPLYFIIFNAISFTLALILHIIFVRVFQWYKQQETIPLAGYQAFSFAVILIIV